MLRDTQRHTSHAQKRRSIFVTKILDTKIPSEATQKRFLFTTIHLYDAAPSRSLLIRSKISALDSLSTFGAEKRAYLEQKDTRKKCFFVSFRATRGEELSGRRTEDIISGAQATSNCSSIPLSSTPADENHLLRAQSSSFLYRRRHHYYNQIFCFLFLQKLFSFTSH